MVFHLAPLQGLTDSVFRNSFCKFFGGVDKYYTPFIRIEKGEVRAKDLKDSDLLRNRTHRLIPQVIAKERDEFNYLISVLKKHGHKHIDINMGCPFVPMVRKGRGSGLLKKPERVREILDIVNSDSDATYSIKMRLGVESADDWKEILPIINDSGIEWITIHPRTARQQYRGNLDIDQFESILSLSNKPIVYNGDILSNLGIDKIKAQYPDLSGIMIGRGLIATPWLLSDSQENIESRFRDMHNIMLDKYISEMSGGDIQIMMKLKGFWEYWGIHFDKKQFKQIIKSNNLSSYIKNTEAAFTSLRI